MRLKKCRYLLIPFSFIYFLLISLRNVSYRFDIFKKYALDARIISVGNITWGGTGKTPAVLFILDLLLKQGRNIAVLTRGYGGDEQRLFSRLAPGVRVVAGKDRIRNGREAAAKYSIDTFLLDDGFQYRALKRDMDIVCIDASNPFGNGWLIPAGTKRETVSALKRADIFLITKADMVRDRRGMEDLEKRLKEVNPDAQIVKSVHRFQHFYKLSNGRLEGIEAVKDKELVLVSAIGNPESFEKTVSGMGIGFKAHFVFRDHHWYRANELERINNYCIKNGVETVITTEKDAIRLKAISYQPSAISFLILAVKLQIIDNEQGFYNRLLGIYNS